MQDSMGTMLSIIIPVYNVEKYLNRCLDSILEQTYENLEIILVDDGSPDRCGEICDEYASKDGRIRVIHQKNRGLCGARNAGLEAARGEFIGFIDSDDYVDKDMYEYLMEGMKTYQPDICACRYYKVSKGGEVMPKTDNEIHFYSSDEAIVDVATRFVLRSYFWNKIFRKELFDDIRFPEGKVYEGTRIAHKIFEKCEKIVLLPEPKYYYCDNEGSIVNTKSINNQCQYTMALIDRYNELIGRFPGIKKKVIRNIISEVSILTKICYLEKDSYSDYSLQIRAIGEFVKENIDYINSNYSTKRVNGANFRFVMNPTKANLSAAHLRQTLFDTKKDREKSRQLSSNRK